MLPFERAGHQFLQTIQLESKALTCCDKCPTKTQLFSLTFPSSILQLITALECYVEKRCCSPWQSKLLNQHLEREEWLLFGFPSARQRY